jgi:hypothetical protein
MAAFASWPCDAGAMSPLAPDARTTYQNSVRTFSHEHIAQLGAYGRLRQALSDISNEAAGGNLGEFLEVWVPRISSTALTSRVARSAARP